MPKPVIYFFLRLANSALGLAWGFVVAYAFIRVLGVGEYAHYVVITAMAIYLSAADIGISNILYAHIHAAYLAGTVGKHAPLAMGATALYFFVAFAGSLAFAIAASTAAISPGTSIIVPWLYFLFTALNLPWLLLRSISWAAEFNFWFEGVDFVRRLLQVSVAVATLAGLRFSIAVAGLDVIWAAAFAAILLRLPGRLGLGPSRGWLTFWRLRGTFVALYGHDIRASMAFTLLEFFVYTFPYAFVPFVYGSGAPVIMFDIFFKMLRGGVAANSAVSSAFVRQQTRAFHERRFDDVRRWSFLILAISLAITLTTGVAILLKGHALFGVLLNRSVAFAPQVQVAIAIALVANSVQSVGGSLFVYTGFIRRAARMAALVAAAMLLLALATPVLHLSAPNFILAYAIVYALGAAMWGVRAFRLATGRGPVTRTQAAQAR